MPDKCYSQLAEAKLTSPTCFYLDRKDYKSKHTQLLIIKTKKSSKTITNKYLFFWILACAQESFF